MGWNF
jgi:hypothetical protein